MTQPDRPNCQDPCAEHSGVKVMQYTILAGVVSCLFMQAYNTFVQNGEIKAQIARIEQKLIALESKDQAIEATLAELKQRVSALESKR